MEFHEVANLFPLIEGQEFDELVRDIKENGLQQPIWTYQNKIIDGRNRYRACKASGVEPRYQEWDGKGSLVAFAVSLNVKRRHLTSSQLSVIALGVEKQLSDEAKERQKKLAGTRPNAVSDLPTKLSEGLKGESAHQAASLVGTSGTYVKEAKRIQENAPELIPHIIEGTLTIPDAKAIAVLPQSRRSKVVEKAVAKKEEEGKRVSRAVKMAIWEEEESIKKIEIEQKVKTVRLSQSMQLLHGDFYSLLQKIQPGSVDMIFTDPPYHESHFQLWFDLSSFASHVLKPGGILLAYSGQMFLPGVLSRLSHHLEYCWLFGVQHTGGHIQIWKHSVWNDWKPLVMFSKGKPVTHDWLMDLYRGDKGDKDAHEWAQGEGEAAYFIEKLTEPGQLVVDPMCGSGTILRAAHKLGRRSIGIEIDQNRFDVAMAGMKDLEEVAV